ncbi:putative serine/threonine-protein kinase [Senna tora]|uniref:Putative serine/threonine-protein kinase n=1 Tax=Senna tora TaxID=362788 RepID=A0A834SGT0_9FABA|nr:putative serine/threonine-protein kinase [Senna tora]
MEAVGARLGRSSTRYGPATVFNGPVRKWEKKWVHVSSSSSASASTNSNTAPSQSRNPSSDAHNASHLSLFKWTPLIQSNNGSNSNAGNNSGNDGAAESHEPPRRKFKYVPAGCIKGGCDFIGRDLVDRIGNFGLVMVKCCRASTMDLYIPPSVVMIPFAQIALLEEQKIEAAENEDKIEDEAQLIDAVPSTADSTRKVEILDKKPDINDIPVEESQSQDNNQVVRQDLNESTLDFLGLMAHDDDREYDSKLIK